MSAKQTKKRITITPSIAVRELFEGLEHDLHLRLLTRHRKLDRRIRSSEIHRPGLAFSGYYYYFAYDRVQVLGKTEVSYLSHLSRQAWRRNLGKFFNFRIPCIIVAKNQNLPRAFLEMAEAADVPVFKSPLKTSTVVSRVTVFIEDSKAPRTTLHGTLVDIFGVGTILLGESGVGKSECALELISRGHRLVADDVVRIQLVSGRELIGSSSEVIRHHMEIRGLGIIDILATFGVGAVRTRKRIDLVVTLERWQKRMEYDRLGLDDRTHQILNVSLPHLVIPVKPGRNIPVLIESTALSQRSKQLGWHAPKAFDARLKNIIASQQDQES